MKARVRPSTPCALVWNYPETQPGWLKLHEICLAYGLTLRPVGSAQAGHTIGALCQLPGASQAATLQFLPDDAFPSALILHGLDRKQLDGLLKELRAAQVQIALKAMVTPTNQAWTLANLLGELCRERDEFARRAAAAKERLQQDSAQ